MGTLGPFTQVPPTVQASVELPHCSILDTRQLLEDWLSKSTFASATWRGNAQRYRLGQALETARVRHEGTTARTGTMTVRTGTKITIGAEMITY